MIFSKSPTATKSGQRKTKVFCCKGVPGDGGFDMDELDKFLNKNTGWDIVGTAIFPTTSVNLLIVTVHGTVK